MKILKKILFIATVAILSISTVGYRARAESLSPNTFASFTFTRNITIGTQGSDVSALQQFLIAGGFLKIPAPTGYFGPTTKKSLSVWQAKVGISPAVGFFGSISRQKINEVLKQAPINIAPAQIIGAPTIIVATTSLAVGTTGNGLPIRLKIPKLTIDAGFQYNGLKDGVMEIPTNVNDIGWFTGSVHPGEKGVAVVTGHVAQIKNGVVTKPGVFYNLKDLRAGDKIDILNDKGKTFTFVVRESRNYDPSADATDVFKSKDDGVHLNLITCEGTWNPTQASYSQRLVIFTDLVK